MKVLKAVLALVGIVGLIGAAVFLFLNFVDTRSLLAAANANKSGNLFGDPMPRMFLSVGVGALGVLLLGLGLGLPPRTAAAVERDTLDAVNDRRSDSIASRALGDPDRTATAPPADRPGGTDAAAPRPDERPTGGPA